MTRPVMLGIGLFALLLPVIASAATYPVDDSASQVLASHLPMEWDNPAPRAGQRATVSGEVTVLLRLNMTPWAGRTGRVYMTLPAQPSGPINVRWGARGPLLPGALRDGERALVYTGPIPAGLLEDTLRLTIQADGDKLVRSERLNFTFEIDLEGP